ncbi:MAG: cytochrome c3 family protein [Polyangiales bacterium]|nr:cytochrome c3 family protein [Myxococcales bacterium]MCB9659141.1 cytochrome c3 family protein [Sandaracinaceae bacterium]
MQIFPRHLNLLPLVIAGAATVGGGVLTGAIWYYASPANLQVGYAPEQPVPYSHRLHAGEMEMDCRYCHANVERSHEAMVPPTQTCMGCHAQVHPESQRLAPVRESFESGESVEWVRVHQVPDHVFFDHSVHLAAGVGCVSCHGRVDQMEVVQIDQPISMGWCLDCHRDPGPNLRPRSEITNMDWAPDENWVAHVDEVNPPTHCSGCHR